MYNNSSIFFKSFNSRDGVPYCESDYQKLFGVKCTYCSRFISGKVLQVKIFLSFKRFL